MTMEPNRERPDLGTRLKNPGGTSGGVGEFILGLVLLVVGGYLFLDNVIVSSNGWGWGWGGWFGGNRPFGITLLPLFLGVVLLFMNGRSIAGWILTIGSALVIFAGIVVNLSVHWRPTSLYYTLLIIGSIAAGIGLIARSVRPHDRE